MKEIKKISLAKMKNLSRNEMRNIMAGSGTLVCGVPCILYYNGTNHSGQCEIFFAPGQMAGCYCVSGGNYALTCNGN
jgi:natural product precursor